MKKGLKAASGIPSILIGFPILIKDNNISRRILINYLEQNGVKTRLIFAGNLIKQPYMKEQIYRIEGNLKKSDLIMKNAFWVGIYPELSKNNLKRISDLIHSFIKK